MTRSYSSTRLYFLNKGDLFSWSTDPFDDVFIVTAKYVSLDTTSVGYRGVEQTPDMLYCSSIDNDNALYSPEVVRILVHGDFDD